MLALLGRLGEVWRLVRSRQVRVVLLAAVMISCNWFLFILSVQIGLATEASLGYYIFPIVAVVIGVVAFGERLDALQGVAAVLATVAVAAADLWAGRAALDRADAGARPSASMVLSRNGFRPIR